MRRIVFEDPILQSKVTLDITEELFTDFRDNFGKKNLRVYLGQLAKQSIERALNPEMARQELGIKEASDDAG